MWTTSEVKDRTESAVPTSIQKKVTRSIAEKGLNDKEPQLEKLTRK